MSDEEPGNDLGLPRGLTLEKVQDAVERSGYPLQTIVEKALRARFRLQPEWGFLDRVTNEMRAIDLLALLHMPDLPSNERRVRPELALVIECKRSQLPYIFFGTDVQGRGNFPYIAGLRSPTITISTDDSKSTWSVSPLHALDLDDHPFITDADACVTLSGGTWQGGGKFSLTGSDAYQSMIMPIKSAVEHFRASYEPAETHQYFDAALVVGLAIVDAPMIRAALNDSGESILTPVTWQRLWRHEPLTDDFGRRYGESSAVDVVHINFLAEYLDAHVMPFAEEFAERAARHDEELATGLAFASGLLADSWSGLEARLEPERPAPRPTQRRRGPRA